jgi:hypothetical protein
MLTDRVVKSLNSSPEESINRFQQISGCLPVALAISIAQSLCSPEIGHKDGLSKLFTM